MVAAARRVEAAASGIRPRMPLVPTDPSAAGGLPKPRGPPRAGRRSSGPDGGAGPPEPARLDRSPPGATGGAARAAAPDRTIAAIPPGPGARWPARQPASRPAPRSRARGPEGPVVRPANLPRAVGTVAEAPFSGPAVRPPPTATTRTWPDRVRPGRSDGRVDPSDPSDRPIPVHPPRRGSSDGSVPDRERSGDRRPSRCAGWQVPATTDPHRRRPRRPPAVARATGAAPNPVTSMS